MSNPIPVIICGRSPAVAAAVQASLLPGYEGALKFLNRTLPLQTQVHLTLGLFAVIHIILSVSAGISEIPALLRGQHPPASDSGENLGTRNYSKLPAAVVTGGGYDDGMVKGMRDACRGERNVPWLRPDMNALPPHGPGYGAAMADKMKACLSKLARDGKMSGDGVYFF